MPKIGDNTLIVSSKIGDGTVIWHNCNLWKCKIGKDCKIASYVEIGEGVRIGNNCKVEAYTFIPPGVTIGNNVFIGPHVVFTNDKWPKATGEWNRSDTVVKDGVSIGANSTILSGIIIEDKAMIGAGSVVTKSVPAGALYYGDGAKQRGTVH